MNVLRNHIESLIFCSTHPVSIEELQDCLSEMFEATVSIKEIEEAVASLQEKYTTTDVAFEVCYKAGGYQFLTKPEYQASIGIFLKQKSKKRLSTSALETLAIIAYKQPITKTETEVIRGVNCDYSIHKLLDKELIEIKGKSEAVGKPLIYGTSSKFMEYFGINNIDELPQPKDFKPEENEIGEVQE